MSLERCVVKVLLSTVNGASRIVGTGMLVSSDLVLTCAHVVEAALGYDEHTHLSQAEVRDRIVSLELGSLTEHAQPGRGNVATWYEVVAEGARHAREDICLLRLQRAAPPQLLPPKDLWCRHRKRRSATLFGFGREGQHLWLDCTWKGPNEHYQQIDVDDSKDLPVVGGYSGGPVLDRETGQLLGMVVAAEADRRTASMIPAALLEPIVTGLVGAEPEENLIDVFLRFLDRFEESQQITRSQSKLHCYVIEGGIDDEPDYLAERLHIQFSFEAARAAGSPPDALRPLSILLTPTMRSTSTLIAELDEECCGVPIAHRLTQSEQPQVVLVNAGSKMDPLVQARWVLEGLDTIAQQESMLRGRLIVILPIYVKRHEWLARWSLRRKLSSLNRERLTLLPRLGEIQELHLKQFLRHLSQPLREKFSAAFVKEGLDLDLPACLGGASSQRYSQVAPKVYEELRKRRRPQQDIEAAQRHGYGS